MLILKVSKHTDRVQQPRQWAVMGSGTGNHLWRNNTLTRIFTPGILPNIVPSPSGSAQDLHRLFAGVFFGEIYKTRNHQPNRWVSKLKGHTEELAKQNTFNNLDPYDDDDTAVFLLEVMLRMKSPGQPTTRMAPLLQQVTTLTVHYSLEGPSKYWAIRSWLIT